MSENRFARAARSAVTGLNALRCLVLLSVLLAVSIAAFAQNGATPSDEPLAHADGDSDANGDGDADADAQRMSCNHHAVAGTLVDTDS